MTSVFSLNQVSRTGNRSLHMKWSRKSQPEVRPGDTRPPYEEMDWPAANGPSDLKRWQRELSATSEAALAARPFANEPRHSMADCVTTDSPDKSRPTKYSGKFKWLRKNRSESKDGRRHDAIYRAKSEMCQQVFLLCHLYCTRNICTAISGVYIIYTHEQQKHELLYCENRAGRVPNKLRWEITCFKGVLLGTTECSSLRLPRNQFGTLIYSREQVITHICGHTG